MLLKYLRNLSCLWRNKREGWSKLFKQTMGGIRSLHNFFGAVRHLSSARLPLRSLSNGHGGTLTPPHCWQWSLPAASCSASFHILELCLLHRGFLYNQMTSFTGPDETLYQRFFGQTLILTDIRVFGATAYPNLRPIRKNIMYFRSDPLIFMGYPRDYKGYMLYNPKSPKIMVSNDVLFFETDFSRNVDGSSSSDLDPLPDTSLWLVQSLPDYSMASPDNRCLMDHVDSSFPEVAISVLEDTLVDDLVIDDDSSLVRPSTHPMRTRAMDGIRKPNPKYVLHIAASPSAPTGSSLALLNPGWKDAMISEFDALIANNTWDLVRRSL